MKRHHKYLAGSFALAASFLIVLPPGHASSNFLSLGSHAPWGDDGYLVQRRLNQINARGSLASGEWNSSRWATKAGVETGREIRELAGKQVEETIKDFNAFLQDHPGHLQGRLLFGDFYNDLGRLDDAAAQWEAARHEHADNPETWVHLANFYAHSGHARKAIEYFEAALRLPDHTAEQVRNYAVVTYLFRRQVRDKFHINEQQVFDRCLALYQQAIKLEPKNYALATDYAMTYYAIKPRRTKEAIAAWEQVMPTAPNIQEQERVHLHLARFYIHDGNFTAARQHLDAVSSTDNVQKVRVARLMDETEETLCRETLMASLETDSNDVAAVPHTEIAVTPEK